MENPLNAPMRFIEQKMEALGEAIEHRIKIELVKEAAALALARLATLDRDNAEKWNRIAREVND